MNSIYENNLLFRGGGLQYWRWWFKGIVGSNFLRNTFERNDCNENAFKRELWNEEITEINQKIL